MKRSISLLLAVSLLAAFAAEAQQIPLPAELPREHPRLLIQAADKGTLQQMIRTEPWAREVLDGISGRIDGYVTQYQSDPEWMVSRLQMYWKTKAKNVYIKGPVYSHADGQAPVPTVRFAASRGGTATHERPALADVLPYMDDPRGLYYRNSQLEGKPLEWVEPSKTGGAIRSINDEIIGYARDAAFMYWLTGDEKYARFAFTQFDTYMMGMYYRDVPIDLNHGHTQTLVGLTYFETIGERILIELATAYDFLYYYLKEKHPDRMTCYADTFKKWIEVIIGHGVPHNNWNLMEANIILKAAMVLEDNAEYADGKGRQYYIDFILNRDAPYQWSVPKLMNYGFDFDNGIWMECPGYAIGVMSRDFMLFIRDFYNTFDLNLLPYMPIMPKSLEALPQYVFPNGMITGFGDTRYSRLNTGSIADMIRVAQKSGDKELEARFTRLYKVFHEPSAAAGGQDLRGYGGAGEERRSQGYAPQISSFFAAKPLELDPAVAAGKLEDYATQTFYAPNVSWFVQRSGIGDARNGLMISQYGSEGNHAHANGVAIELYGKGYILGAESGIGTSYFQPDYLEYYSQFPAHNTVMVDGVSSYPEMLSHHAFDLLGCYPAPGQRGGYYPGITFSEVYFLEPESRSDQNRLLSIVRTGETSGYYVDIFRSRKQRSGDKFHDYFYHNLGQELFIRDRQGRDLPLELSSEMAFAGGHLFALDYMWDKRSARTEGDYQAVWKMSVPDGDHVYMNLWMKGYPGREVFSIKAPPTKAFAEGMLPYNAREEPYLTIAARQHGEAWNRPFVSVFEPSTEKEGRSVAGIESFEAPGASPDFVGLAVKSKGGRVDYIFSSVEKEKVSYRDMAAEATYAVVSEQGAGFVLFLGAGTAVSGRGFTIEAPEATSAALLYDGTDYYFSCESPVTITAPDGKTTRMETTPYRRIRL